MSLLRLIAGLSLFWTLLIAGTMAYGAAFPSNEIVFDARTEDQFIAQWMDVRTHIIRVLPLQSSSQHRIQLSPDAEWIAYLVKNTDQNMITFINMHGRESRLPVTVPEEMGAIMDLAWSPDGTRIAVGTQNCLGMLDAEGAEPPANLIPPGCAFAANSLTWSPDGTRLAYNNGGPSTAMLNIYDFTTGQVHLLTHGDDPDWSPDGSRIVYVSNFTVAIINADGGRPTPIARGFAPSWSPDGAWIAFSQGFDSPVDLMLYNVETGQTHTLLSNGAANIVSDWRPRG